MAYVVPIWQITSLPVQGGGDSFPVRRIYCVGRNYAAHAREMGGDPDREPPFFFMKPADAIVLCADPAKPTKLPYPPATKNFHHEMELVAAIGKGGADIKLEAALDHVWGYAAGLDMTRRDIQFAMRDKGRPWDMGKGFDHSAPCSPLAPAAKIGHPKSGRIELKVNGATKQKADLKDLIWSVPETVSYLSGLVRLEAGDLIYTGTPEGVGPVVKGDKLEGEIEGVAKFACVVV